MGRPFSLLATSYVLEEGPVAQLDRALASGARGRAFESRRAHSSEPEASPGPRSW